MTNDELEEIRARAEAATAGPWDGESTAITDWRDFTFTMEWMANGDYANEKNDRAFIAHARTDIPALLDEVERRRGESAKEAEAREAMLGVTHRQMTDVIELRARATRAEAHAAALAGAITRSLPMLYGPHEWGYRDPVVGGFVEDRTPFNAAARLEEALSAYRGVKDEACSRPSDALDAPVADQSTTCSQPVGR